MTVEEKINHLRQKIIKHNIQYYVHDEPVITDGEYDKLFKQLENLENKYPKLITNDSPTQRVGSEPKSGFNTIEHRIPLLSLANAMNEGDLSQFNDQVEKILKSRKEILQKMNSFQCCTTRFS